MPSDFIKKNHCVICFSCKIKCIAHCFSQCYAKQKINLACPNPGNLEPWHIDNPVNIIDDIQNTEMFKT